MRCRIARRFFTRKSSLGEWFTDEAKVCDTLEDRVRVDPTPGTPANEAKVYGETAIPALTYVLALEKPHRTIWSPRNGEALPEDDEKLIKLYWRGPDGSLGEVPGYTGIYVHAANRPEELLGCIATGTRDPAVPDWIGASRAALTALMAHVGPALERGDVVPLVVEEFGRPNDALLV